MSAPNFINGILTWSTYESESVKLFKYTHVQTLIPEIPSYY